MVRPASLLAQHIRRAVTEKKCFPGGKQTVVAKRQRVSSFCNISAAHVKREITKTTAHSFLPGYKGKGKL